MVRSKFTLFFFNVIKFSSIQIFAVFIFAYRALMKYTKNLHHTKISHFTVYTKILHDIILCIVTMLNLFMKVLQHEVNFVYSIVQPLRQRSNCCRSRKCIWGHIPMHAIFAVFYLFSYLSYLGHLSLLGLETKTRR